MAAESQRVVEPNRKADFALEDLSFVVGLARHPGPIGDALRSLPAWLLQAADDWAKFNFE